MTPNVDEEFAICCQGVTKSYGTGPSTVTALRGIDLGVYRGELLMLVGPSGCGKTTLISIISTILDQDAGHCSILGHEYRFLEQEDKERFRRESIGFVFQAFNLLPALTAMENVAIPLLINGKPRDVALDQAFGILESVGLSSRAEAIPAKLSGGEQQRVAIARALVHDPQLIVCDEPTSNLDHATGHAMMALLRDIACRPDRTLVVVTHDDRILEFADRIAHMDDGRIVNIGTGTERSRQS